MPPSPRAPEAIALRLLQGGEADLPFVMATERLPGYEHLVGRWDLERHAQALADGRHAYFIAARGAEPVGFAILRDWNSPEKVSSVKRVAVAQPGVGLGRAVVGLVADAVFTRTDAYRLWLSLFPDNLRARRAYEACGFVGEGIARGSAYFGGTHRDELVMALLRPDWLARGGRDA